LIGNNSVYEFFVFAAAALSALSAGDTNAVPPEPPAAIMEMVEANLRLKT